MSEPWKPRLMAIDDLELDGLALLKVDVDGNELGVLQSGAMQIERFRPTLYIQNDVRSASAPLLTFMMRDLGYDAYWHPAPIFDKDNFFGNPVNHWGQDNVVSLMVLGVPRERKLVIPGLRKVTAVDDWWTEESPAKGAP